MPRYFMHLRDGTDETLDPEGVVMPPSEFPRVALASARDCISSDARQGQIDLRYRIDVEDELGRLVHSLEFADAVEIVRTH